MSTNIKNEPETDQNEQESLEPDKIALKRENKPELPAKSSMEILSELFSTFDAEPPVIVKEEQMEESIGKKHKKKKKHKKDKKHKKKSKKRSHSTSNSSDEKEMVDLAQILIKQEKDLVAKKLKLKELIYH